MMGVVMHLGAIVLAVVMFVSATALSTTHAASLGTPERVEADAAKSLVGKRCTKPGAIRADGPGRSVVCAKAKSGKNKGKLIWMLVLGPTPTPTPSPSPSPAVKPLAVTQLEGTFNGLRLRVTWTYPDRSADFTNFVVTISKKDDSSPAQFRTTNTEFSTGRTDLLSQFGEQPSEIKVTVQAKNRANISSDPTTIVVAEGCLPPPTNPRLEASTLGYTVSWDPQEIEGLQATMIYESSTPEGPYVFAYSTSTSPVFVPSTNFTPRFIKVGNASFTDKVCQQVPTTPRSVTPINPVAIDVTPPGPIVSPTASFSP